MMRITLLDALLLMIIGVALAGVLGQDRTTEVLQECWAQVERMIG